MNKNIFNIALTDSLISDTALIQTYNSRSVESGWYDWWEANKFFRFNRKSKEPFVMVLPPPNVTGNLHIGHALTATIQDAIIRR